MYGHTRQDTLFAFDESQLAFTTNPGYPSRSYSSASSTSSEYWNYSSSSSSYTSHSGSLSYGSSQKPPRSWSNDSGAGVDAPFPRNINSYDASLRSTEMRQQSIYTSNTDLWSSSQLSSQWSNTNAPDPSWNNVAIPGIDAFEAETKPIVDHNHLPIGSCSPLSTISSPSPSPSPIHTASNTTPKLGRRPSTSSTAKICSHCHATSTPLWRREPSTLRTLCNACGLYLQQRNKLRPQELIDADADDDSECSEQDGTGPECSHCHTRNTSVWRRSKTGAQLCNACGVYARLRGKDRPLSLKRNKVKPRTKHAKPLPEKQS
ncbi:hypothetical protein GGU10DRAFT_331837 [Lentinula aff. detonsa]|uniref:GATA-type domain-containing protein n=1 Tax=Lentinula aff. detonsa TaxID=2804958 RepID=A0AA38KQV8_9AGAR|nr:hypothetical protein GGU10DRAFT_331837 [Lentinula aff. detonsa]